MSNIPEKHHWTLTFNQRHFISFQLVMSPRNWLSTLLTARVSSLPGTVCNLPYLLRSFANAASSAALACAFHFEWLPECMGSSGVFFLDASVHGSLIPFDPASRL